MSNPNLNTPRLSHSKVKHSHGTSKAIIENGIFGGSWLQRGNSNGIGDVVVMTGVYGDPATMSTGRSGM